ncbi:MAG: tRNA (adenosine(37)-N6)-dimethylallyltransferase MiaA [Bdellovibrionales bacterium RIFOXYD12_FULL_39_22]|nr:MAG: tRNA (adenosine(37)-N6)-dimethylallyltransferase MiaA [Bdellovibrionales bacterium RIFOXYB1_FULL_39_21]OFZ41847.1 MAG: tRNA (adenosine(37)-N6)-dimethylallyltransferase MiaA [Bdellovibrionales bacterium RIFOXYC12_FULL_39_17]OFZ50563.1 MAG: tRNA (adenosine(37)-N6)-dimethylallyltransferase MiaA [Bdellovibrionales bacterium RIFOXYC1_FULL_39_130]OFZ75274.1 MAG: tRNA (adenosine(37)-N6)-dimethylallyltransferase MiaA [Bdellovibrionales bacterium RIFOXYC2_FULL_39_8]OFZ77786.1 MAG: tRNA (adenosin
MNNFEQNPIFIISGPTASGKTALSIALAQAIEASSKRKVVVVNFDSLLFYKELNICTAKPSAHEMAIVPHELISFATIAAPINAAQYCEMATSLIEKLRRENKIILLVGGSVFYVRALIKGMYAKEKCHIGDLSDLEVRHRSNLLFSNEGIAPFLQILKEQDPLSYSSLHHNDQYRIIRAVEYFWSCGKKISDQKQAFDQNRPYDLTSSDIHPDWQLVHISLDIDKVAHQKIIQARTEAMFRNGIIEEVSELLAQGFSKETRPLQSVGPKEVLAFLNGEIPTISECVDRIVVSTRQLAKAQRTWLNKSNPKFKYDPRDERDQLIAKALSFLGPSS